MQTIHAIFLGIIEGLTEFLPISSTGHLVIANYFLGYDLSSDFIQVFQISVQLGAVLAIVFFYFKSLIKIENIKLLSVGVLPTIFIGLLLKDQVKIFLSMVSLVAYMLIMGGIFMILVEFWYKKQKDFKDKVNYKDSFLFGIFQSLAMVPGVSRSGAIIVSGLLMKYKREVIAEHAFLLAVPTMFAATGYSILKNKEIIINNENNLASLIVGFVFAFLSALMVLKILIPFVKKYSFIPFAIYRMVLGLILLSIL